MLSHCSFMPQCSRIYDFLQGSLVDSEKFRFDFSSKRALEIEDVAKTEFIINQVVSQNVPVYAQIAPLKDSKEIQGLLKAHRNGALFYRLLICRTACHVR